ncbi:hypothetical protein V1524DRAFT_423688 [Lipomyces starkeyi]
MKTVPKPFWNEHSARISQNLWLPSLDLIERELSGELVNNEQVHKEQPGKVRRIRVYPSTKQKETLRKWLGTARWTLQPIFGCGGKGGDCKNEERPHS